MPATSVQRREFVEATCQLVASTLNLRRMAFYSVDEEQNLHDFICFGVPGEFHRLYLREMYRFDPLHARHTPEDTGRVGRMNEVVHGGNRADADEYVRFVRRYGVTEAVEFIFRTPHRPIAGLCAMWTANDAAPNETVFALADHLQRYIQFNITSISRVSTMKRSLEESRRLFHLTKREADVADLLCVGRTNGEIADALGIGLPTVKTHLIHIYEKTSTESRSALVARLGGLV